MKLDDAGLKKWYDDNAKSLELPERTKLRMVRFDAAASNALAAVTVTEDALRDHYDVTVDKYTTTDTNGVETVKKFEDVRAEVEKEVRLIDQVPRYGAGNARIAFVHPKATGGVLLELTQRM